jgi:hypothetical protein
MTSADRVFELRTEEIGREMENMLRVRARGMMRIRFVQDVGFDGRWHALKVGENFEVILDK